MKVVVFDYLGSIDPDSVGAVMDVGTWQAQPGIADAIAHLNHHGWHVVQAVNQPGLGRGSLEIAELTAVQQRLQKILNAAGGRIEAFFFCPHAPEEHCDCRKPAPGLLLQIAARCGVAPPELCVAGLWGFHQLPVARFPAIAFPMTTVTITQPGASPSQLESEVTRRVEE